jgi:hypothetical protein
LGFTLCIGISLRAYHSPVLTAERLFEKGLYESASSYFTGSALTLEDHPNGRRIITTWKLAIIFKSGI